MISEIVIYPRLISPPSMLALLCADTSLYSIGTDNRGGRSSTSGSSCMGSLAASRLGKSNLACPLVPGGVQGGPAPPVRAFNHAESHDCVTVFFSDIVGFSTWAHELPPGKVWGRGTYLVSILLPRRQQDGNYLNVRDGATLLNCD